MKDNIEKAKDLIQEMKSDTIAQLRARSEKDNPELTAFYKGYVLGIETAELVLKEYLE